MDRNIRYIIITPAKDEEKYIEQTIKSVASQTIKPLEWVIVNDGSTDNTGLILKDFAKRYPWINVVDRENKGTRKAGGRDIDVFYYGYKAMRSGDADFIIKMDADLSFDNDYFGRCFERFRNDARLGIGGGIIYQESNGAFVPEVGPLFHVRGATKIYRKECWEAIGGPINAPAWDTLDEVKANMLGWKTCSFNDIKLVHLRPTGAAYGAWRNLMKNGRMGYIAGYHPLFMVFRCFKRIAQKPYVIGSMALLCGFLSGYLRSLPQAQDKALIKYLRQQQLRRLFFRETIWR